MTGADLRAAVLRANDTEAVSVLDATFITAGTSWERIAFEAREHQVIVEAQIGAQPEEVRSAVFGVYFSAFLSGIASGIGTNVQELGTRINHGMEDAA